MGPALVLAVLAALPPARGGAEPLPEAPAAADSAARGDYLRRLQGADRAFYPPEALDLRRDLADSGLAALDSLGFRSFVKENRRRGRGGGVEFGLAGRLMGYNRVEGGVAGVGARFPAGIPGGRLEVEGAYATASERFRHLEILTTPLTPYRGGPYLELGFSDHVVPYGSNRPAANGLRAFLGSADAQDYLERRGGSARLGWDRSPAGAVSLGYEAARELSVAAHTGFGVFGPEALMGGNAAVDEGIERAAVLRWSAGSILDGRWAASAGHRVAGGGLGGAFTYTRAEASVSLRRYLPLNHEGVLDLGAVRTGGAPPVQALADVGGLSTVRGWDRRARVGRESLHGRLEILVPYDVLARMRAPLLRDLHLQFVPWADAGRVWSPRPAYRGAPAAGDEGWITSAGLGLQYYLGPFGEVSYLRFDAAAPLGPDRPDDVRFYLRFARGLF